MGAEKKLRGQIVRARAERNRISTALVDPRYRQDATAKYLMERRIRLLDSKIEAATAQLIERREKGL